MEHLTGKLKFHTIQLTILFTTLTILVLGSSVQAQSKVQVTAIPVDFTFGKEIIFKAQIQSSLKISDVILFFVAESQPDTITRQVLLGEDGLWTYVHDPQQRSLPAFSKVKYWYRVTLEDGDFQDSQIFEFEYNDRPNDWETLEEEPFRVHWYAGDVTFAREVLDMANASRDFIYRKLVLQGPNTWVDIYVYENAQELQTALQFGGQSWVAGHTNPELRVILVSLSADDPEYVIELQRQVPHELAHILLFEQTGVGYANLPTWLNEGIASFSELYPNPDYPLLLENAYQDDRLIPMRSLCYGFPSDASNALLAYAQATTFTRFLSETYGISGVQDLVNAYADGLNCDNGVQEALGHNLSQLETEWRQVYFSENTVFRALAGIYPWLILMGMTLGPIFLLGGILFRGRTTGKGFQDASE